MTSGDPGDLLERAAELRRAGRPFVLATVVRSLRPASARPGDRALVAPDAPLLGWVGGGCVQTTIEREARRALRDGSPRLVRLSPEPHDEDGIVSYPMTCHSGGTLEIYLEPVLPPPELVVLGDSPVAAALATLAEPLGFRVRHALDAVRSMANTWVVAAGMSSGEDDPLAREALLQGVPYVAMVASRRRAAGFIQQLRDEGVADEVLQRLKAPAGLDIGAATGPEIALSILAEIVQRRRQQRPSPLNISAAAAPAAHPQSAPVAQHQPEPANQHGPEPAAPHQPEATGHHRPESAEHQPLVQPEPATALDPICGMLVEIATARWTAERDGQVYYFCAPGCRKAFLARTAVT